MNSMQKKNKSKQCVDLYKSLDSWVLRRNYYIVRTIVILTIHIYHFVSERKCHVFYSTCKCQVPIYSWDTFTVS